MITSDYSTDNIEFKYQWSIQNFTDYFTDVRENKTCTKRLKFSCNSSEYSLELVIDSENVKWYFGVNSASKWQILKCELSILDKNGVPFPTVTRLMYDPKNRPDFEIMSMKMAKLQSQEWNLLHDKNLKMSWSILQKQIYFPKQHESMKDTFEELLKSENDSDVVFEVDGKEFKAHKFVLMARSPVFATMFSIDMIEKRTGRVTIVDISPSIFEILLHFIYTDQIMMKLDFETGMDLMKAASKYQLEGLEALCEAELFQLLTPINAMDVMLEAMENHLDPFVKALSNFITELLEATSFL